MTEAEWLAATNAAPMLVHLRQHTSDRKFRLFAVACCRRIWRRFSDPAARDAVDTADSFADGTATQEQLAAARASTVERLRATRAHFTQGTLGCAWFVTDGLAAFAAEGVCRAAQRADYSMEWQEALRQSIRTHRHGDIVSLGERSNAEEAVHQAAHVALIRDSFGNPFRPVVFDSSWRTETVVALAAGIYADRAFDRLPVLADALDDAGCTHPDLLAHCRAPGPHVRGCWAVDLLLGKA